MVVFYAFKYVVFYNIYSLGLCNKLVQNTSHNRMPIKRNHIGSLKAIGMHACMFI